MLKQRTRKLRSQIVREGTIRFQFDLRKCHWSGCPARGFLATDALVVCGRGWHVDSSGVGRWRRRRIELMALAVVVVVVVVVVVRRGTCP